MSATYEAEQKHLQERVTQLKDSLDKAKEDSLNAEDFLSLVRKYTDIRELDAEIIREFVERIVVSKPERIDEQSVNVLRISITALEQLNYQMSKEKRHIRIKRLYRYFQR